jgi:hypothetical protein
MSVSNIYYIDSYDFASATKIYIDANRTILAPTGWYKFSNRVRKFENGSFVSTDFCDCPNNCDYEFSVNAVVASAYSAAFDIGTDTGAIVIRTTPISKNIGMSASYNSVDYKDVYVDTSLLTTAEDFVIWGAATSSPCPNISTEQEYSCASYVMSANVFYDISSEAVSIIPSQVNVTGLETGMIIIPKPTSATGTLNVYWYALCNATLFSAEGNCVETLPALEYYGFSSNSGTACDTPIEEPNVFYYVKVDLAAPSLSVGDVVFSDPNAENKLTEGFYILLNTLPNIVMAVNVNGVVTSITECP